MNIRFFRSIIIGAFVTGSSIASETAHWGYEGEIGPAHWGGLSPDYSVCSSGKNQSPIDLSGMIEGELPKLELDYKPGGNQVVNNGHTIKINYTPESTMIVAGRRYELKQVHFHSPSENTLEGQSYPMEAHLVHADKDGNLSVIAQFYNYGEPNRELEKAWIAIPSESGKVYPLLENVDAMKLLPGNNDYYRFNGSLTTPPCSEGVKWFVIKQVATLSKEQIDKFKQIMGHANNRPLQAKNARIVIQ